MNGEPARWAILASMLAMSKPETQKTCHNGHADSPCSQGAPRFKLCSIGRAAAHHHMQNGPLHKRSFVQREITERSGNGLGLDDVCPTLKQPELLLLLAHRRSGAAVSALLVPACSLRNLLPRFLEECLSHRRVKGETGGLLPQQRLSFSSAACSPNNVFISFDSLTSRRCNLSAKERACRTQIRRLPACSHQRHP